MATSLENLSDEILIQILSQSKFDDVIRMCEVSRKFGQICRDSAVWSVKIKEDFPDSPQWLIDAMRSRGINGFNIYRILYQNRWLKPGLEQQIIFRLSLGDEGVGDFIINSLEKKQFTAFGTMVYTASEEGSHSEIFNYSDRTILEIWEKIYLEMSREDLKYSGIRILDGKDTNDYPVHYIFETSHAFLNLIISIYLSGLYRNETSINFFNLQNTYKQDSIEIEEAPVLENEEGEDEEGEEVEVVDKNTLGIWMEFDGGKGLNYDARHFYWFESSSQSQLPSLIIQILHLELVMERKYNLIIMEESIINRYDIQVVKDEDIWQGRKLNKADFWAYRVGKTILYFRPGDFIVKFNNDTVVAKFTYPYLSDGLIQKAKDGADAQNIIDNRGYFWKMFMDDLLTDRNIMGVPFIDPLNRLLTVGQRWKSARFRGNKEFLPEMSYWDIYFLLQSPTLFGEYMYPEGLTANSKVIILGEI